MWGAAAHCCQVPGARCSPYRYIISYIYLSMRPGRDADGTRGYSNSKSYETELDTLNKLSEVTMLTRRRLRWGGVLARAVWRGSRFPRTCQATTFLGLSSYFCGFYHQSWSGGGGQARHRLTTQRQSVLCSGAELQSEDQSWISVFIDCIVRYLQVAIIYFWPSMHKLWSSPLEHDVQQEIWWRQMIW